MRTTIKFGVITGIISGVFLFGFFSIAIALNRHFGWEIQASRIQGIGGLLSIPIQAIGIYMAMQNYKKINGTLTYGQAIKTGIIVAVTIAVVVAVFSFLYCRVVNPGFREFMVKDTQKAMIAKGAGQQDIDQGMSITSKQFSTGSQVMMALIGQFAVGTIISLIIGLFVRTKKAD
jgi:hypothetical protein